MKVTAPRFLSGGNNMRVGRRITPSGWLAGKMQQAAAVTCTIALRASTQHRGTKQPGTHRSHQAWHASRQVSVADATYLLVPQVSQGRGSRPSMPRWRPGLGEQRENLLYPLVLPLTHYYQCANCFIPCTTKAFTAGAGKVAVLLNLGAMG